MAFSYFSLTNEDPEGGSTFLPGLCLAQKLDLEPRTLLLETAFISNPTTILWDREYYPSFIKQKKRSPECLTHNAQGDAVQVQGSQFHLRDAHSPH